MINHQLSPCIIVQLPLQYLHFTSSFGLEWPIIPCPGYPHVLVVSLFLHGLAGVCVWVTVARVPTHEPASAPEEFVLTRLGSPCNLSLNTGYCLDLFHLPGHRLSWNLQEMICHWYFAVLSDGLVVITWQMDGQRASLVSCIPLGNQTENPYGMSYRTHWINFSGLQMYLNHKLLIRDMQISENCYKMNSRWGWYTLYFQEKKFFFFPETSSFLKFSLSNRLPLEFPRNIQIYFRT